MTVFISEHTIGKSFLDPLVVGVYAIGSAYDVPIDIAPQRAERPWHSLSVSPPEASLRTGKCAQISITGAVNKGLGCDRIYARFGGTDRERDAFAGFDDVNQLGVICEFHASLFHHFLIYQLEPLGFYRGSIISDASFFFCTLEELFAKPTGEKVLPIAKLHECRYEPRSAESS